MSGIAVTETTCHSIFYSFFSFTVKYIKSKQYNTYKIT